jgi:hypothetical protein
MASVLLILLSDLGRNLGVQAVIWVRLLAWYRPTAVYRA